MQWERIAQQLEGHYGLPQIDVYCWGVEGGEVEMFDIYFQEDGSTSG